MIEQNEKKQGKLVYYIIAITFLIIAVLSSLQVLVVKERAKKSVAASYEENCRRITDAYANVVSIRLSEYIKQMRMYTEADVTKTVDPVEIQSWLIEHASSRTVNNEIGGVVVGFNKFTEKLHSIVSDVKSSKETLEAAGEVSFRMQGERHKKSVDIRNVDLHSVACQECFRVICPCGFKKARRALLSDFGDGIRDEIEKKLVIFRERQDFSCTAKTFSLL